MLKPQTIGPCYEPEGDQGELITIIEIIKISNHKIIIMTKETMMATIIITITIMEIMTIETMVTTVVTIIMMTKEITITIITMIVITERK